MSEKINITVPFDPGYSKFYPSIDPNIKEQIDFVLKIKQPNTKKHQLRIIEGILTGPFNIMSCFYYACVVYGSIIGIKYKNPPASISGNPMLKLSEEEARVADLTIEIKVLIEIYKNLKRGIEFNLKRKSKLPEEFENNLNLYIEFVEANDHFKTLESTEQIKLPEKTRHFTEYSKEKIIDLEKKALEIAESGKLPEILNIF